MHRHDCDVRSGRQSWPCAQLPLHAGNVPPHGGAAAWQPHTPALISPHVWPSVEHVPKHGGVEFSHVGTGSVVDVVVLPAGAQFAPSGIW